ncbi:MAG: hypothetical protein U1E78_10605 [Gammaproteobacteria bacterium]
MAADGPRQELVESLQATTAEVAQQEDKLDGAIANGNSQSVGEVNDDLNKIANNLADTLEKKGEELGESFGERLKRRAGEIRDIAKSRNQRDPNSPMEHGGMLVNNKAKEKYGMKTGKTSIDELIEELIENITKSLSVTPMRIYAFYAAKNQPEISAEREPAQPAPTPTPDPTVTAQRESESQLDRLAQAQATLQTEADTTRIAAGENPSAQQEEPSHTYTPAAETAAHRAEELREQEAKQPKEDNKKEKEVEKTPSPRSRRNSI